MQNSKTSNILALNNFSPHSTKAKYASVQTVILCFGAPSYA